MKEFKIFGLSHIITLSLLTVLTIFLLHFLQRFDPNWLKKKIHPWFAFIMFTQTFIYRLIFILQNDFRLDYDLPFHLCGLSEFLLIIMLLRPSQKLFDLLYYFVMAGSLFGLIIPDIQKDFPSARFFSLFVSHWLMVFYIIYFMVIHNMRPSYRSYWNAFKILNLYALIVAPINYFLPGNYLYLCQPPAVNFKPVEWLPDWPWYIIVLDLFFLLIYWLMYLPFAPSTIEAVHETESQKPINL